MIFYAEQLIDLLEQKNLVAADLVDGLRERIAQTPNSIPAEIFARRLVDHGVLTESLCDALLRQLQRNAETNSNSTIPTKNQTVTTALPTASKNASKNDPPVQQGAQPLTLRKSTDPPLTPRDIPPPRKKIAPSLPSVAERNQAKETSRKNRMDSQRFSLKKKSKNPWDSKLIVFGLGALLVLLLVGVFLLGSLSRRSAETVFSEANRLYDGGSYSQAIIAYTDYLRAFPNHSGASTAKIHRAMARIRLLVDAKSDWLKAWETAYTEIKAIENEPYFFEESNAELAILLPRIASGLAAEAVKKTSLQHAEQAGQALALIGEMLPRSLQPTEQLAEARTQIERVRRLLVQGDKFNDVESALASILKTKPFGTDELKRCYDLLDKIKESFPEIETDPKYFEAFRRISQTEWKAVRALTPNELPDAVIEPAPPELPVHQSAVLYYRTFSRNSGVSEDTPVYLSARNQIFGLRASDGMPLWKRTLGKQGTEMPTASQPISLSTSMPKILPMHDATALVVDAEAWHLDRINGKTGKVLWRLPIEEPFYVSEIGRIGATPVVVATTRSGKLLKIFFDASATRIEGVQLPQAVDSPPLIDPVNRLVFQFARRNTLYILPFGKDEKSRSSFFGQKPETIRTASVLFQSNLLVVRQTGLKDCEMIVFSPTEEPPVFPGQEKTIGRPMQIIPIRGLVDAPPAIDGAHLVLTSDSGETLLFDWKDTGNAKTEYRFQKIAEGSVGGNATEKGTARYATPIGKNVWIADWQLTRFEPQLAQTRLLSRETVRKDIVTLGPLRRIENTLFHAYRDPTFGGVFLSALSLENGGENNLTKNSVCWETELAEPIVLEPKPVDTESFDIYTSSGKTYQIPVSGGVHPAFYGEPKTRLPRGKFGTKPLGNIVALKDGFEAWIPDIESQRNRVSSVSVTDSTFRNLPIYDPAAADTTRFRSMSFSIPWSAQPIGLAGNLLVPLSDGRIDLRDPRSSNSVVRPFLPRAEIDALPLWSDPVPLTDSSNSHSSEFLVIDNRPDENGRFTLYQIELKPDETPNRPATLFVQKKISLENPVFRPMTVVSKRALLIDSRNVLQTIKLGNADTETSVEKTELLGSVCVWGPHAVGDSFLFALADKGLFVVDSKGNLLPIASVTPIGKPFSDENGILLNSASGTLWRINPRHFEFAETVETGVQTSVGPVRFGTKTILSGVDGTVYEIKN